MANLQNDSSPRGRPDAATDSATARKLAARNRLVAVRVKAISPKGSRCVLEHRANSRLVGVGIELCHCFARANAFDDILMRSIEFRWGMERGSLSLDSRWNCIFMGSDFHAMFDKGLWGLVPSMDTLERYDLATQKDIQDEEPAIEGGENVTRSKRLMSVMEEDDIDVNLPEHKGKSHVYTLLAFHRAMRKTPIDRHLKKFPVLDSDFTRYTFPFLPSEGEHLQIRSHIHPKFVILSLGQQLAKPKRITKAMKKRDHVLPFTEHLDMVQKLYEAWTAKLNRAQLDDSVFPAFIPTPVAQAKYDKEGPSYRLPSKFKGSGAPDRRPRTRSVSRREQQQEARAASPLGRIQRVPPDSPEGQAEDESTDVECALSDSEDDEEESEEEEEEESEQEEEQEVLVEGEEGNEMIDGEAVDEENDDGAGDSPSVKKRGTKREAPESASPDPPSSPMGRLASMRSASVMQNGIAGPSTLTDYSTILMDLDEGSSRGRPSMRKKMRNSAD
ncbi:hypothetical protein CVT24_005226 [Panaeolus cyanescens]|uniref:HNH nuclease domain-containing protein n=1 Tax=Panaeolus cyanescens TaxID=181874 RepID=A0A409Y9I4_9AGAR|nr:hypothetical protein CVT24_005226 [Panaeolus cyanescens]